MDLAVGKGELVALLGLNGAGKSTTLRSILGLTRPRNGEIYVRRSSDSPDGPPIVSRAWVLDTFPKAVACSRSSRSSKICSSPRTGAKVEWSIARVLEHLPKLKELSAAGRAVFPAANRRCSLSDAALVSNPDLLLVDEPSQGLAPMIVEDVYRILAELKARGVAIVLVEQNALLALKIADRAYVMDAGRIVYHGEAATLLQDRKLIADLMGLTAAELAS